jgi:hypothetical protein
LPNIREQLGLLHLHLPSAKPERMKTREWERWSSRVAELRAARAAYWVQFPQEELDWLDAQSAEIAVACERQRATMAA